MNELESLNRKFFWTDKEQKKRMHLIAWNLNRQDKKEGGLGLKNQMNLALLAKLAWRMCTSPNSLWVNMLWKKYGSPFIDKIWNSNISHIWRAIVAGASVIRKVGLFIEQATLQNNEKAFKVKNATKLYILHWLFENDNNDRKEIWRIKGPLRLNLNLWFTKHMRLFTSELLHKRKVLPDTYL